MLVKYEFVVTNFTRARDVINYERYVRIDISRRLGRPIQIKISLTIIFEVHTKIYLTRKLIVSLMANENYTLTCFFGLPKKVMLSKVSHLNENICINKTTYCLMHYLKYVDIISSFCCCFFSN